MSDFRSHPILSIRPSVWALGLFGLALCWAVWAPVLGF